MATQSPFSWLEDATQQLVRRLEPPAWAQEELRRRLVLALNHVLQQEPQAQDRLARQCGRVVMFEWRDVQCKMVATAAGLLDLAADDAPAELTLCIAEPSPMRIAQSLAQGQKPEVRIQGDVQLAAEVNWLVDHVRWDVEEDLSRLIGDVPAHALAQGCRRAWAALRDFLNIRRGSAP